MEQNADSGCDLGLEVELGLVVVLHMVDSGWVVGQGKIKKAEFNF